MAESEAGQPVVSRMEGLLRRFWARLGARLDSLSGKGGGAGVDLGAIIPAIERAVEDRLQHEGERVIAPNIIDLRFDYETFNRLSEHQRDYMRSELRGNVTEYIYNRRYVIAGEVSVRVGFDPFTKRLAVTASFPGEKTAGEYTAPTKTKEKSPASATVEHLLKLKTSTQKRPIELSARLKTGAAPVGLGRSRDNVLVIDDSSVSNFHASFIHGQGDTIYLSDLGSSNGTSINGSPIDANDRQPVRSGDRLRFGDIEMTVEINDCD